jgi:predicted transcriptional regulator of viral defense system
MAKLMDQQIYANLPPCFADVEVQNLIHGSDNSRYAILKRAVAKKDILHLRRGLYCAAPLYRRRDLNLFEIAQRIYGPSYLSFESALSYHGLIPESVATVSSACARRSREFETELCLFSFVRIPARVFFAHVDRVEEGPDVFFMARPWRAIVDYIYANGKEWCGLHPLVQSLRIEEEELKITTRDELEELEHSFGNGRVTKFLRGVIKDLGL